MCEGEDYFEDLQYKKNTKLMQQIARMLNSMTPEGSRGIVDAFVKPFAASGGENIFEKNKPLHPNDNNDLYLH